VEKWASFRCVAVYVHFVLEFDGGGISRHCKLSRLNQFHLYQIERLSSHMDAL
jgi:hypothetical protein